jgi:hypothetical protein
MSRIVSATAWVVALLAALEGLFWLFGVISIWRGNPYRLYYADRLAAQIEAILRNERTPSPTGWGSQKARPHPHFAKRQCGSAWGGSFTFADDVSDDEAWPYLASVRLGCEIANFGIKGFGFDQTLLLFQEHPPQQSVVILVMVRPMVIAGATSSWTFVDLDNHLPRARLTKPMFTLQEGTLHLKSRPEPTVEAITRTYREDIYGRGWTPLQFPFTLSIARALYRWQTIQDPHAIDVMGPTIEARQWREVAIATIAAMAKAAVQNDDRFVVLLLPLPGYLTDPGLVAMLNALAKQAPAACLIDPTEELKQIAATLHDPPGLETATGHFNAVGNAALADALVRGLGRCGIIP